MGRARAGEVGQVLRELLRKHGTITFVFQQNLPTGPVEGAQERVNRRQGSQLTATVIVWKRMIQTNYADESFGYGCDRFL